jgi:two-component system sensor histidine kinase KdpD
MSRGLYIPVQSSRGPLGVLAVYARDVGSLFVPEQKHLLETLTNQVGFALERDILSEEKQRVLLQIESERLRSSLFQSVSHDLRTPLAIINGTCSSLLEEGDQYDGDTRTKLLSVVLDETRWLTQLVDNLLNISKIESGVSPVMKQWVPLEEVVGSSIARIEKHWPGGRVFTRIPEEMFIVSIDPVLVEQVLVNLLDNALKYAPEVSPVEIDIARDSREVTVSVLDRGPGIADGDKEAVFDKFYRTREARTSGRRGAGIGLAICKSIVEAHHGSIGVRDREGGGSVFWFTLPIEEEPPTVSDAEEDGEVRG